MHLLLLLRNAIRVGWKEGLFLAVAIPFSLLWAQTLGSPLRPESSAPEAALEDNEPVTTIRA
jgi:hypothetical protein